MKKWVLLIQPRNILPWQFLFSFHFLKCYHFRKHDCVQSRRKWPKNRHDFKFSCLVDFSKNKRSDNFRIFEFSFPVPLCLRWPFLQTLDIKMIKRWKVVGSDVSILLIKVAIFSLKSSRVPFFLKSNKKHRIKN